MKIAFVLNFLEPTGGDRIIWRHLNCLRNLGHQADVFSQGKLHESLNTFWDNENGIKFYDKESFGSIDFRSYDAVIGCGLWGAKNALQANNPNKVFFCQNFDPWVFSGENQNKQRMDYVYFNYDSFLVYSHDLAKAIKNRYGEKNFFYCTNGVEYKGLKEHQKTGYKNNKRVCFMSVYNGVLKGPDLAKNVFALLQKKGYTTIAINAIGQRLANATEFYNAPSFEEKSKLIAESSIFLNTSIFETWCLAIHEAMALGTPVVCTESYGINEYLGKNDAVVVKERSAERLVEEIEKLCKDKERYLEIQENAIRNAERYEWEKVMPEIEKTYQMIGKEALPGQYSGSPAAGREHSLNNNGLLVLERGRTKKYLHVVLNGLRVKYRPKGAFGASDERAINEFARGIYTMEKFSLRKDATIVDVGAHIGTFSLAASKIIPNGKLVAYEPEAENFKLLKENLALNSVKAAIHRKAVAGKDGSCSLNISNYSSDVHNIVSDNIMDIFQCDSKKTVECVSLETVFRENKLGKIDLLKLDCEGAEYQILFSSSKETLLKVDQILLEYHDLSPEESGAGLIGFLVKNGFHLISDQNIINIPWARDMIGILYFSRSPKKGKNPFFDEIDDSLSIGKINGVQFFYRQKTTDEFIINEIFEKNEYDLSLFNLGETPVIIDIGTHIGLFSLKTAKDFPKSRIIAYEPESKNFSLLQKNLKLNESIKNIFAYKKGVAKENKKRTLYISNFGTPFGLQTGGHSFESAIIQPNQSNPLTKTEIECISLENVFQENKIEEIDLLKMDCEGAEFEILFSAPKECLEKIKNIIFEYHEFSGTNLNFLELDKYLQENGFNRIKTIEGTKCEYFNLGVAYYSKGINPINPSLLGGLKIIITSHEWGGFFSNFLKVLQLCKDNQATTTGAEVLMLSGTSRLNYLPKGTNIWNYCFEPVPKNFFLGDKNRPKKTLILERYGELSITWTNQHDRYLDITGGWRKDYNEVFNKIVRPLPRLQNKIDSFWNEHFNSDDYVIGILYRGNNLAKEQINGKIPSTADYLKAINEELLLHPNAKIFASVDNEETIGFFKRNFGDKVVCTDISRSLNPNTEPHQAPMQLEDIHKHYREVALLSKCNILVHPVSNMATCAFIMNPKLKSKYLIG